MTTLNTYFSDVYLVNKIFSEICRKPADIHLVPASYHARSFCHGFSTRQVPLFAVVTAGCFYSDLNFSSTTEAHSERRLLDGFESAAFAE